MVCTILKANKGLSGMPVSKLHHSPRGCFVGLALHHDVHGYRRAALMRPVRSPGLISSATTSNRGRSALI